MSQTNPLQTIELVLSWVLMIAALLAPLVLQIFGVLWWMRRGIKRAGTSLKSWGALQGQSLLWNASCTAGETLLVWAILVVTSRTGHYLGYVGFALIALVMSYAVISFVVGFILTNALWWNQKNFHGEKNRIESGAD